MKRLTVETDEHRITLRVPVQDNVVECEQAIEDIKRAAIIKLFNYEKIHEDPVMLRNAIYGLREFVWGFDIPSPICPEYVEHHKQIQQILQFIDQKILQIVPKE